MSTVITDSDAGSFDDEEAGETILQQCRDPSRGCHGTCPVCAYPGTPLADMSEQQFQRAAINATPGPPGHPGTRLAAFSRPRPVHPRTPAPHNQRDRTRG